MLTTLLWNNGNVVFCRLWAILQGLKMQWNHIFNCCQCSRLAFMLVQYFKHCLIEIAHGQQYVSKISLKSYATYSFSWPKGCEQHWRLCGRQPHHIFSYDQQGVSNIEYSEKGLIMSFPMTNRECVTSHIVWKAHHILSFDQQEVSSIAHFLKHCLITWPTACK